MALVGCAILAAAASAVFTRVEQPPGPEVAVGRSPSPDPSVQALIGDDPSIAAPVEDAFDFARRGSLDQYLAQFTSPLRENLDRLRQTKGDDYLRGYLVRLTRPIKGIAADIAGRRETGPDEAQLSVDFIFSDHNERQSYRMKKIGSGWKISQIQDARSAAILIPYGTPIQDVSVTR